MVRNMKCVLIILLIIIIIIFICSVEPWSRCVSSAECKRLNSSEYTRVQEPR